MHVLVPPDRKPVYANVISLMDHVAGEPNTLGPWNGGDRELVEAPAFKDLNPRTKGPVKLVMALSRTQSVR
jgi:hypothetical protein